MENNENLPSCCKPKKERKSKTILGGIAYGLIPHIGCIMFIIGSILGVTILMRFFRPLLMNRYIFHYLILISLGFATLSSFIYLKKHKHLSWKGVKKKKGYLFIMYGSTIGINLILFIFIFPLLTNFTGAAITDTTGLSLMAIKVDIPCPGHAPLISNELGTIEGVEGSEYSFPNKFDVYYDASQTSEQEILSLEVFDEYPAQILGSEEKEIKEAQEVAPRKPTSSSTCSGGCGGTESCGGSCGSPTCNYNG